jgi:hypothetical protein
VIVVPSDRITYPKLFRWLGGKFYGHIIDFKSLSSKIEDGYFYYGKLHKKTKKINFKRASSAVQVYLNGTIKPINECLYDDNNIQIVEATISKKLLKEIKKNVAFKEVILSMSIYKTIASELAAIDPKYHAEICEGKTITEIPSPLWLTGTHSSVGFSTVADHGHAYIQYPRNNERDWEVIMHKGVLLITKNIIEKFQEQSAKPIIEHDGKQIMGDKFVDNKPTEQEVEACVETQLANDQSIKQVTTQLNSTTILVPTEKFHTRLNTLIEEDCCEYYNSGNKVTPGTIWSRLKALEKLDGQFFSICEEDGKKSILWTKLNGDKKTLPWDSFCTLISRIKKAHGISCRKTRV